MPRLTAAVDSVLECSAKFGGLDLADNIIRPDIVVV